MMGWSKLETAPHGRPQSHKAHGARGQGATIAIAVVTLVAIVSMALALNQGAFYNARRMVSNRQSLQLYYVAQAGIQEALATRFVPRTNYLNFLRYSGQNNNTPPLYGLSGKVFRNPANAVNSELIGYYRYFVLGGDPTADATTGAIRTDYLTANSQIRQPFSMLSKGSICVSDTGEVGVGVIRVQMTDGDNPRPYCTDNRFRIDELTLSASADLSRTVNVSSDVITAYDIHKTDTAVPLGRSMFAPGLNNGNPVSTINFETVWSATGSGGTAEPFNELAVRPTRVAFYTMAQGVPDTNKNIPITGANTTVGALINPRSVIKVFFNGGVDYRTLYIDPKLNQTIDANCVATPANCHVRVRDQFGTLFTNSTLFPNFPGETQFLLLPPLGTGSVMNSTRTYTITLENIVDWQGNRLPQPYTITFTTN
ncbi:MAG: hypothetical protein IPK79_06575 [Vampirovibrionales bacterium]|nr:hypothetical protein [Vampirovibrionales bacterium]